MKKCVEATGKTIDDAISAALEMLGGVDRDLVTVEVLENPKSGFLGIGGTPAKVSVCFEEAENAVQWDEMIERAIEGVKYESVD